MRLPRPVLATVAALCVVAAGAGFLAGANAGVTETDVINTGAALYEGETGGSRLDCLGVPGTGAVWIEVRCGDGADIRTYLFDEKGMRLTSSRGSQI